MKNNNGYNVKTRFRKIRKSFNLEKNKLFDDIAKLEPKSVANTIKITWSKAKDFSLFDDSGNQWIDLTSGIFVSNAGHSNPLIKKAIKKQVDNDLLFAYNYPTQIKYDFLKKLLELSPSNFDSVALLNSGSEAMDIIYKLIKLYGIQKKKKYIVTFKMNYHGRGLSTDLISGSKEKASWSGVEDKNIHFLDFPYAESDTFIPESLPPAEQIAGFVIETFQGWGAWFYPQKFIDELYLFARKHGALIAFDELQAGFYRLGPIYGYMTYGEHIEPDLVGLGKGISSSLPIGGVLGKKEIFDIDEKADLHGTHSGNAVSCAAALANLDFLSGKNQVQKRKELIKMFREELISLETEPLVKKVNVRGVIAGVIFEKGEDAIAIVKDCINQGVLPVCTNRNSIKIAPPLTISGEALVEAIGVLRLAIHRQAEKISK